MILKICKIFQNKIFLYFGEHGAELDYIIGTTITDLTNLKNSASNTQLSPSAITKVIVGWNYLDAIFNFMFSLSLFTNTTDYRYKQNIVKGIINSLSGIELFVFTYNPPLNAALRLQGDIALAGTAFAVAMAGDLICASIDFHNIYRESYFPGWLDEKIKAYKYAVVHNLETEKLVKDMRSRCKAYINGDLEKDDSVVKLIKHQFSSNSEEPPSLEKLTQNLEKVNKKNRARDQWIQEQMDAAYKKNRTFLGIKAISMVGMILLAVAGFLENSNDNSINNSTNDFSNNSTNNSTNDSSNNSYPITLTLGLVLTTLVSSYYFLINAERLTAQTGKVCNRFFPAKKDIRAVELKEIHTENAVLS